MKNIYKILIIIGLSVLISFVVLITHNEQPIKQENELHPYLECSDIFNAVYGDFVKNIPDCTVASENKVVCEPALFSTKYLENNERFNELECTKNVEEWAHLSDYNDTVWYLWPEYPHDSPPIKRVLEENDRLLICQLMEIECTSDIEFTSIFYPQYKTTELQTFARNMEFNFVISDDEICGFSESPLNLHKCLSR